MHAELRQRIGSGSPLVYVPGIDGTGCYLLGTEQRLAAEHVVVSVRYRSDEHEGGYPELAASVATVVRGELGGPALVVAESFGVAVALQLALDHPDLVSGLLLVNGFARFERQARLALSRLFAPLVTPRLFALGRPLAARLGLFGARRDDPALERFLAQEPGTIGRGYRQRLAMIQRADLLSRLHELTLPVAIYASSADRVVPAVAAGRAMAERLPDASFEVLEGAGHLVLPLESEPWPARVAALERRIASTARERP